MVYKEYKMLKVLGGFIATAIIITSIFGSFFFSKESRAANCVLRSSGFTNGPYVLNGIGGSMTLAVKFHVTSCSEQSMKTEVADKVKFGMLAASNSSFSVPSSQRISTFPFSSFILDESTKNSNLKSWDLLVEFTSSKWTEFYDGWGNAKAYDLDKFYVTPKTVWPGTIYNDYGYWKKHFIIEIPVSNSTPGPTPVPAGNDYAPIPDSIKVCQYPKGSQTVVRVHWETKIDANSAINYRKEGGETKELGFNNYLKSHFITLNSLEKNATYIFQVGGRTQDNAEYKNSGKGSFVAGQRHDPGCKDGGTVDTNSNTNTGNANSNNGIPNNATNTGVSATLGSLDQSIGNFFNPLQKNTLPELMATLLRILFAIIGTLAVIIIIVAGFKMVLSNGNEAELTKAKAAIIWALIGLFVAFMSYAIVAIIQKLL